MKTYPFLPRKHRSLCATLLILSAFSPFDAFAAIVADFSGGNGTSASNQFVGTAGDGWLGAWAVNNYENVNPGETTVLKAGDSRYNPLQDDQMYLAIRFRKGKSAKDVAGAAVSRQYGAANGVSLTEEHTISFYYRVDSALTTFTNLAIWEASNLTIGPDTNSYVTWLTDVSTSQTWQFLNDTGGTGTGRVDSGVAVKQGNIYHFTITVNPVSNNYTVQLQDVTDNVSYSSSSTLSFRYKNKTSGGKIVFSAIPTLDPNDVVQLDFSVGGIVIAPIPEGGTAGLLFTAAPALAWLGARTRFGNTSKSSSIQSYLK